MTSAPGLVVLVVDDEADHVMMLEILLESVGFAVLTASSVAEGRQRLAQEHVDVLLTDYFLGDGTALDLLDGIGARRPARSIVMSGLDASEAIDRSLAAGFDAHLVKPTPIDKLLAAIEEGRPRTRTSEIRLSGRASDTPLPRTKRSAG